MMLKSLRLHAGESRDGSIGSNELAHVYEDGGHTSVLSALSASLPAKELYSVSTGWLLWATTIKAKGAAGDVVLEIVDR